MKRLPKRMWRYFWETDPSGIDTEQAAGYVIPRLMDYGKTKDVVWMMHEYGGDIVKGVLRERRGISEKSASFWAWLLKVPPKEVKCLNRLLLPKPYGV